MANDRLRIVIDLDANDRATASVERVTQDVTRSVRSMESDVTGSFSSIRRRWKELITAFGTGMAIKGLVDTATEIDAITQRLKFASGGVEQAAASWRFLQSESARLGLNLRSAAAEFGNFAAAARGTTLQGDGVKQVFLAVAEAATVMNLSEEKSGRAFTALTQMMSKGRIQAEEVIQQLSEAFPGAVQVFARAMNMTTDEFFKFMEAGRALPAEVLPRFAAQLRKEASGELGEAVVQLRQNLNRMQNAWFEFQQAIIQAGFGEAASDTVRDLTLSLKRLGEHVRGSDGVAVFFTNLADAGKALGSVAVPAVENMVSALGALSRGFNELPDFLKSTIGAGAAAGIVTRNPAVALGVGAGVGSNSLMEQINQWLGMDLLPSVQANVRLSEAMIKRVKDLQFPNRDIMPQPARGGTFRMLEQASMRGAAAGLEKKLSQDLDAVISQLDDIQKKRAGLAEDPLGRIRSGNADADAQMRAKAVSEARSEVERRINDLLEERAGLAERASETEELQADLADATAYYNQLQKLMADIRAFGRTSMAGYVDELPAIAEEAAAVKQYMDEVALAIRNGNSGMQQMREILAERAIFEEQSRLRQLEAQQTASDRAAVLANIAELERALAAGYVTDQKAQQVITALLKQQTAEEQNLANLTAQRAEAMRRLETAASGDEWQGARDAVAKFDEALMFANERAGMIKNSLDSIPKDMMVKIDADEVAAAKKMEGLYSTYLQLQQTIVLDVNTDAANLKMDALAQKMAYIASLGGADFVLKMFMAQSPAEPFSKGYAKLLDRLNSLPTGSSYQMDVLMSYGLNASGAAQAVQQYSSLSSLEAKLSQAYQDLEYYQKNTYGGYARPSTGAMASYYENTVIPKLKAEIQQQSLSLMSAVGSGWNSGSTAKSSGAVSTASSGGGGITINVNTINVNAPGSGSGRDVAIGAAASIDSELAALIKSNRSQIRQALGV